MYLYVFIHYAAHSARKRVRMPFSKKREFREKSLALLQLYSFLSSLWLHYFFLNCSSDLHETQSDPSLTHFRFKFDLRDYMLSFTKQGNGNHSPSSERIFFIVCSSFLVLCFHPRQALDRDSRTQTKLKMNTSLRTC